MKRKTWYQSPSLPVYPISSNSISRQTSHYQFTDNEKKKSNYENKIIADTQLNPNFTMDFIVPRRPLPVLLELYEDNPKSRTIPGNYNQLLFVKKERKERPHETSRCTQEDCFLNCFQDLAYCPYHSLQQEKNVKNKQKNDKFDESTMNKLGTIKSSIFDWLQETPTIPYIKSILKQQQILCGLNSLDILTNDKVKMCYIDSENTTDPKRLHFFCGKITWCWHFHSDDKDMTLIRDDAYDPYTTHSELLRFKTDQQETITIQETINRIISFFHGINYYCTYSRNDVDELRLMDLFRIAGRTQDFPKHVFHFNVCTKVFSKIFNHDNARSLELGSLSLKRLGHFMLKANNCDKEKEREDSIEIMYNFMKVHITSDMDIVKIDALQTRRVLDVLRYFLSKK